MNPNDLNQLKEEAEKLFEEIEKSWERDYTILIWCIVFTIAAAAIGILAFMGGVIK